MTEENPISRPLAFNQRRNLVLISAALLLTQHLTGALTTSTHYSPTRRAFLPHPLHASTQQKDATETSTKLHQSYRLGSTHVKESWWSPSEERSSRLKVRRRVRSALGRLKKSSLSAEGDSNNTAEKTWSQPVEKSSSLGVRKRVKAVLKKAKSRTGVENNSDEETSPGLLIAEVASIGGLAEQSDVIFKKKNGVKKNGVKRNGSATSKAPSVPRWDELDVSRGASNSTVSSTRAKELEVLRADVPTPPPEPLPFQLPQLKADQRAALLADERVQEQSKMGREGSGFVVMDVKAPPYVIWECLLDFENYPDLIKTVRSMEMFTSNKLKAGYHAEKPVPKGSTRELRHYGIPSVTRAAFVLSKFKLNIAAIHNYRPHPDGHYMVFNLDPECTNMVLKSAKGIWYTQSNPDGRGEEYTRVWLLCELKVSSLLPKFIVDYTAKRAMPRATNWLKPYVEPLAEKWRKEHEEETSK